MDLVTNALICNLAIELFYYSPPYFVQMCALVT